MLRYTLTKRSFSNYQNKLLINNKFVPSLSGKEFPTINPSTEQEICKVAQAGTEDVNAAVQAAKTAFQGQWGKEQYEFRRSLLNRVADHLEKNLNEIATIESIDNGKPIYMAMFDVGASINTLRYYAGWTEKIHGQTLPMMGTNMGYTIKTPIGVCGQITPWNFPLLMATFKIAPILATGCTGVLKPSPDAPLSALKLGEYLVECGMPEGVINIIPGFIDAGKAIVEHPDVSKIAFTGSSATGSQIMRDASQTLKKISLELGGKSPNIIFDDANFEKAVSSANFGCFLNSGQYCMAGTRVFVQEGIYDEFVKNQVKIASQMNMGDPFEEGVNNGPVINQTQMDKILGLINKGVFEGATLSHGGKRIAKKGYFIEPTIFSDVEDHMTIAIQEIFGPVMSIMKFKTVDEVIERANNHYLGLAGAVSTQNIDKAMKISNALEAGLVFINDYSGPQMTTPFGGYKASGFGRELGEKSLDEYMQHKSVILKLNTE